VHIDAHADVNDHMFGEKIAHGTTFRRAVEEGLLDCDRVVQIGLRAQGYTADDFNWSRRQGFRVVQAEECWHKSLAPLMAEVREKVGGGPVYLSSTSTASTRHGRRYRHPGNRRTDHHPGNRDHPWLPGPRPDRLRPGRSLAALRHHRQHLAAGANLLYEMLCVLPGVAHR
jgi:guanidinobutyrase